MQEPESLQAWEPEVGPELPLARVIDLAFDYRGNTTVVKTDGTALSGYVFNRIPDAPEPFIQMFDANGDGPITILYREIRTIKFTGKDMAAGNSYAAWLRLKEQGKHGMAGSIAGGA
jgi:hypothetical protein